MFPGWHGHRKSSPAFMELRSILNLQETCMGKHRVWRGGGLFDLVIGDVHAVRGVYPQPLVSQHMPQDGVQSPEQKWRAQRRVFHPLHVLSLVLVRVRLHLSCVFFTLVTCTDDGACSLSFHFKCCWCELLDLVFSYFISSPMIAESGSLCIYGCFFGKFWGMFPLLNGLVPEQLPESWSGRARCSPQCSEQSSSLPAAHGHLCLSWGCPAAALSFSLATLWGTEKGLFIPLLI